MEVVDIRYKDYAVSAQWDAKLLRYRLEIQKGASPLWSSDYMDTPHNLNVPNIMAVVDGFGIKMPPEFISGLYKMRYGEYK